MRTDRDRGPRRRPEDSPGARALRAAGFVPLPRLWVRPEDLAQVRARAEAYADEVNAIRAGARQAGEGE